VKNFIFLSLAIATLITPAKSFGFNFTATPTSESCPGNGTITFSSTDTNPNGSIVYFVYKLPDVSIPLATVSSSSITGLVGGTYKISAREYIGTTFTSKDTTVVINSNLESLTYSIISLNNLCTSLRDIKINVLTGTAAFYEIFDGPVIFPLQSNNTFHNVPAGVYQIRVFDACGNGFVTTYKVTISPNVLAIGGQKITNTIPLVCDSVVISHAITPTPGSAISYPVTINFTTNPPSGNTPINLTNTIASGNPELITFTQTVPMFMNSTYKITITDNCGNTFTKTFVLKSAIKFDSVLNVVNCNNIELSMHAASFSPPYSMTFNSYPAGFNPYVGNASYPGPYDIGSVNFGTVPAGNYNVTIEDACGRTVTSNFDVGATIENLGIGKTIRPGKDLQKTSVKINSKNSKLTSITITSAPASFPYALPYNGNSNIAFDGNFYMNNLPSGDYTFSCMDECNFENTETISIEGYTITSSDLSLQANCGSFNIPLYFESNANAKQKFWLQKEISPNVWGNPMTNVVYTNGTVPTATNSYLLTNDAINYNFMINGTFRVVRNFVIYNNGSEINSGATVEKACMEILDPIMHFNQAMELKDIYRIPCSPSGNLDVIVIASASTAINYQIIKKDNVPFLVNNGNSNVFTNLLPGTYTFLIMDDCGNSILRVFDISRLISLVVAYPPSDISKCSVNPTTENFDLSTQNQFILGSQSPADYTLTYFTSIANAQNNTNPITNITSFHPTSNQQTIFARLIFNRLPACYQITSFKIVITIEPKIALGDTYNGCSSEAVILDASLNNLPTTTYLWSTGQTTPKISVSEHGVNNLTVTVTNTIGGYVCTNTKAITVYISSAPIIDRVDVQDFQDDENNITIYTVNTGDFEYSIDGINYQDNNSFGNLSSDQYTVYVKDKNGCGVAFQTVWILNYPRFFTPNGDGSNDTWYIKNLNREQDYKITINDRYNNLIKIIDSKSINWDGKLNGTELVSDDYWFTIQRQDGREYKGHFAMKR
jgi:gliding motility-associated-like protein